MKPKRILKWLLTGILPMVILFMFHPVFFPLSGCSGPTAEKTTGAGQVSGKISISGAFALYPLTVKWAEEFEKIYPEVQIDISAGGAGKGMADVLSGMVDLAMFSREVSLVETNRGAWGIAVAKDAVFPTVNVHNPEYAMIKKMGLTKEQFRKVFLNDQLSWGIFLGNASITKLHVYTRSDACGAAAMWANFLGLEQENLQGTGVYGDPGMADAVIHDPLGVGYNNLVYLYDLETRKSIAGISVLPIDFNGNRIIDPEEDCYESMDEVFRAIVDGRYPSPPGRNLYLVSNGIPESVAISTFLKYILTEGQSLVATAGYIQLDSAMISLQKTKISSSGL